ncbi:MULTISPECIES: BadF/BadG/BcrA/BcrD ATPase family protein [unclassified Mesorhizobium]|uniref:BadF/BadG/BcrA/BcrD ATPase family protein n=1 Tax=unclassified Mesorhizobium TaxID=325217 RepID=UPI000FDB4A76|nr:MULTISPECIES: BadF/BadG/BcrA/BcrD ATPase family protein [unclassified Mesorhizobium]TGQ16751.1 ATPase [Mesorhizobium sp. M2E.F.Ca.ET.219.01.1.1]TGT77156.1 ATPase [Mesorhizobium sp. M2E.F.Ca.ET.166.01.1.1]TGW03264.1 ATPase [Mesorhizobium sp. M2E.F.Ca.ET.154.01.1.1]
MFVGQNLLVGVDIGGTKTRIMGRRGSSALFDKTVVTDEWRIRQMEADALKLAAIVMDLCGGSAPAAIAVGAHGCDTDEQCLRFQALLSANLKTSVRVVNDAELMVPAAGYDDGIGVVAGTGSIAVARTAEGKMLAAGGWGWILGDEGSAAALVREAAKAIRRALDRGQEGDPLIAALMREIGTDDQTKLGILLNETRGAAAWGRYANAVFDAANAGSPLASRVIKEGGEGLAALVQLLIERGANASLVVAGGGVIAEQPMLMEAFVRAMASVSPTSRVVLLREPPVIGAVALAGRLVAGKKRGNG